MSSVVGEAFSGNRIVKAFLMEDAENRRFQSITQRLFQTNLRQRMTHALSSPLMETLGIFVARGLCHLREPTANEVGIADGLHSCPRKTVRRRPANEWNQQLFPAGPRSIVSDF